MPYIYAYWQAETERLENGTYEHYLLLYCTKCATDKNNPLFIEGLTQLFGDETPICTVCRKQIGKNALKRWILKVRAGI